MKPKGNEIIGNYEVTENNEVVTRREVILMGALAAGGLLASAPSLAAETTAISAATSPSAAAVGTYVAKDFNTLVTNPMNGLSAKQIEQHLKLYAGYVGKINEIQGKLKDADLTNPNATYSPLRELLVEQSFALNGVLYHEFYFANLGGKGGEPTGDLKAAVEGRFGTVGKFMDYLKAAGKCMRGWVIIGYNTRDGQLHPYGLDMHNMWVPAGVIPILVLDVYEHAYMIDYGIDRGKYLDAFVNNLNWEVCGNRFAKARKHPWGADTTA
jgi:Fe-Mn family superoxide dismutase